MNPSKTGLALVLTVLILAAMALLPGTLGIIRDLLENEKPGSAPMQSVELSIGDDRTDEPGYMLRKLALEQRMTTVPIEISRASMTEEEVIAAAQNGMTAYMEAGLFTWFEYSFCAAEAYLGVDPVDESNHSIFWGVSFTANTDSGQPYQSLFLHIDDETGKILYLDYETYGPEMRDFYYPENQQLAMEGFVEAFLRPLHLTAGQLTEYTDLTRVSAVEQDTTDEVTCVMYTFEDAHYGIIHAAFEISPVALRIFFPDP